MKHTPNYCEHNFIQTMYTNIRYCKSCGVFKLNENILYKTEVFITPCEFDKTYILTQINNKKHKISNPYYLKKRTNLLDYLKKFINVCNYPESIYYQTLHLVDSIMLRHNYYTRNNKYDLVIIGCLLLAGKTY
jgi:hypothetical protein